MGADDGVAEIEEDLELETTEEDGVDELKVMTEVLKDVEDSDVLVLKTVEVLEATDAELEVVVMGRM